MINGWPLFTSVYFPFLTQQKRYCPFTSKTGAFRPIHVILLNEVGRTRILGLSIMANASIQLHSTNSIAMNHFLQIVSMLILLIGIRPAIAQMCNPDISTVQTVPPSNLVPPNSLEVHIGSESRYRSSENCPVPSAPLTFSMGKVLATSLNKIYQQHVLLRDTAVSYKDMYKLKTQ